MLDVRYNFVHEVPYRADRRIAEDDNDMALRGYQHAYSSRCAAVHDVPARERKARTMLAVLGDHFAGRLHDLDLLDVGASTGIIDNVLAGAIRNVVGVDIDAGAIAYATRAFGRSNLSFIVGDAMALPFPDESFDVAVCAHAYEHVPDSRRMIEEVLRVLKPGGACYFAAGNRLMWIEPHYGLPLLSVLPRPLAHAYVRAAGKAHHYHELHLTCRGLEKLVRGFVLHDYTRRIVTAPKAFGVDYMLQPGSAKAALARIVARYAYWLMPGYIWILEKPRLNPRRGATVSA